MKNYTLYAFLSRGSKGKGLFFDDILIGRGHFRCTQIFSCVSEDGFQSFRVAGLYGVSGSIFILYL